jgi:uncharacterized protein (DUF362 family)/Pyruvate/2-oxoacid:ferredoxin oxidoreductase delta subunit
MPQSVSVVKCSEYDQAEESVNKALELLGGIERFIKKGDKVLIKPNFVSKKKPSDAATTHPEILRAVIKAAESAGGIVTIAESPGGVYSPGVLKGLYSVCGAEYASEGTNALLNYDTSFSEVRYPEGKTLKSFPIIKPVTDADVIISIPKLKTHAMTDYTGAVKNLYGVIPGTYKAELHFRLNEKKAFCSMLLDLCGCVKPTLSIMDAVWGMEGNGPTAGKNRKIGLVMASADPYALDLVCTHLIGYKAHEAETVRQACERGLCPWDIKNVEIFGENIEQLVINDFKKPDSHFDLLKLLPVPAAVRAGLTAMMSARPEIMYDKCIGCGECFRCCPPKAIEMREGKPEINKKTCIKCFCCQELCPKQAVAIKRSLMNRILLKLLR